MAQAVEEWYKQMPIITRSYLTAAIVITVGCSLDIISPYNLYLHPKLVVKHYQFWRLITNFLYFRKMDLDFLFHMFFLARYCKLLEENSFRGRTADFFYMLLFGATVLTGIVLIGGMIPYVSESFAKIIFLSNSLTFMMVYVWSKQNPFIHMSFLGLFTFTAAYLPWHLGWKCQLVIEVWALAFCGSIASLLCPIIRKSRIRSSLVVLAMLYCIVSIDPLAQLYHWIPNTECLRRYFYGYIASVLLGFSVLVGASAWVDLLGMVAGHAYYFLEDVYPRMTGRRPLKTPSFIRSLFADEPVVVARPANVRFAAPPVEEAQQN